MRPFLGLLVTVGDFGATQEGMPVLKALKTLPDLMGRKKVGPAEIDTGLLAGSWRRLVLSAPHLERAVSVSSAGAAGTPPSPIAGPPIGGRAIWLRRIDSERMPVTRARW